MNKTLKIMLVALMVLTLVVIPTMSAASDIVSGMNGGSDLGEAGEKITNMTNVVVTAIRYIGAGVSVIMLAVLGVMYMLGSAEQKAEYKKSFIPYIIGIVLLFAATQIAGFIIGAAESLNS